MSYEELIENLDRKREALDRYAPHYPKSIREKDLADRALRRAQRALKQAKECETLMVRYHIEHL